MQGYATTCQTLFKTLEIHIPVLKTCNQDTENLMVELNDNKHENLKS